MVHQNFYNSTTFYLLHMQVTNNQNRSENARNMKKINSEVMTTIFFNSEKCINFEVSSLSLALGFQVSSLGVFDEVSVLVSGVTSPQFGGQIF